MALEEDDSFAVCAEAADAAAAIQEAQRLKPDVSLLGCDIPGGVLEAVRTISSADCDSAVVVLAKGRDRDELLTALRAGAVGYVAGDTTSQGLRRVVHAVLANEVAVPRSMVRDLVAELRASALTGERTTGRQAQVLDALRRGDTTAEIARRLGISPVTVRRHISGLVHRLGVENRAALSDAGHNGR
jgi:DNA-binding NarL/FixJ family response regulator